MTRTLTFASVLFALGGLVAGCFDNVRTEFPEGLEPWEPHIAPPPDPTADDPCPEILNMVEAPRFGRANNVHGTACIHMPIADVWEAMQDPEVGHDPGVNAWSAIEPPMVEECPDGLYQTQINAGSPISVDFRLCWRYGVVTGTEAAPTLGALRWQKVWGTSAISVLEGSLIAEPFEGQPEDITILYYQYHLQSAGGDTNTIVNYLNVIYGRLRERAHGTVLGP